MRSGSRHEMDSMDLVATLQNVLVSCTGTRQIYSMTGNVFLTRYKMMPDFPAYYRVDYALLAHFVCAFGIFNMYSACVCVSYHFHPPELTPR